MTSSPKTLIGIPTVNEIGNLPKLVDEIHTLVPEADIVVVDDHSDDGTAEWIDKRAATDSRVSGIHRARKMGSGSAIMAAMRYAIEAGYKQVLVMDADYSHHPRYVRPMIDAMDNGDEPVMDVVIGSMYAPGSSTEGWPLHRYLLSRGANIYTRLMLGLAARDCSNAFRCYRVSLLKQIDLDRVISQGFSFQEEILWRLKLAGARMHEVPTVFANRVAGSSKISLREPLNALWIIGWLGLRSRLGMTRKERTCRGSGSS